MYATHFLFIYLRIFSSSATLIDSKDDFLVAKTCFFLKMSIQNCLTLLFANLPPGTSIAVDGLFLTSTLPVAGQDAAVALKGIKQIGPGTHTVHWSSPGHPSLDQDALSGLQVLESSQRSGVFFNVPAGCAGLHQVIACWWDQAKETMEIKRFGERLGRFGPEEVDVESFMEEYFQNSMVSYADLDDAAKRESRPPGGFIEEICDTLDTTSSAHSGKGAEKLLRYKETRPWPVRHPKCKDGLYLDWSALCYYLNAHVDILQKVLPKDLGQELYTVDTMMATDKEVSSLERETINASKAGGKKQFVPKPLVKPKKGLISISQEPIPKMQIKRPKEAGNDSIKFVSKKIPQFEAVKEKTFQFVEIDLKKTWRPGAIGAQRSLDYLDKSWYFTQLLKTQYHNSISAWNAELELSFAVFVLYGNWSCALQWRQMVTLLLQCESFATDARTVLLFLQGLDTVIVHLMLIPTEYLQVLGREYMAELVQQFCENASSAGPDSWFSQKENVVGVDAVLESVARLKVVCNRFGF